jgi:hypothetical protein
LAVNFGRPSNSKSLFANSQRYVLIDARRRCQPFSGRRWFITGAESNDLDVLHSLFSHDVAHDELIAGPNHCWMRTMRAARRKIDRVDDVCGRVEVAVALVITIDRVTCVIIVGLLVSNIVGYNIAVTRSMSVAVGASVETVVVLRLADSTSGREQTGGAEAQPQSADDE